MARSHDLKTQISLSERSGVGQTTIGRITRLEADAGIETVDSIARAYRLAPGDLLDPGLVGRLSGSDSNIQGTRGTGGMVPLISWVTAGMFEECIDNLSPGDAEDWLESPFPHSKGSFCLQVSGESMDPDYRDGEIIQVDPEVAASSGSDVVVRTPDGKTTFKRLQIDGNGEMYLLVVNPDWPDRILRAPEGTVICGVVIGSWMDRRLK
tara:strand:+ start:11382 stop:12008 length:627 start_codon:yes stop_codon:yes gene_type:complete